MKPTKGRMRTTWTRPWKNRGIPPGWRRSSGRDSGTTNHARAAMSSVKAASAQKTTLHVACVMMKAPRTGASIGAKPTIAWRRLIARARRLAVRDVDEDRAAHRGGDAAAETLEDSAHEEHPDVGCEHADHGADKGDNAARDDGAAAPDLVRDGAAQDLAGRVAHEEGREREPEHRRVRREVRRDLRESGRVHVGRHRRHGVLHGQRDQQATVSAPPTIPPWSRVSLVLWCDCVPLGTLNRRIGPII